MTLRISGRNNIVYRNDASQTLQVTIVASGDASLEVLPRSGTAIHRQSFGRRGGALSVDVPPAHRVEIDVAGSEEIGIEFLAGKPPT